MLQLGPPEVSFSMLSPLAPQPSKELLEEHYGELKKKPFFPSLVDFMATGPVVAMVRTLADGAVLELR